MIVAELRSLDALWAGLPDGDELLTVYEVALRFKVEPKTVRKWIKCGLIPERRTGRGRGHYRIAKSELARLLK